MNKRSAGILLPITSLPSKFGIGDFGPEALNFAKFLHDAGQKLWQVLPMTTIDPGCGNSPYSPTSAFAGNFLLTSPELLVSDNLILSDELNRLAAKYDFNKDPDKVDYEAAREFKTEVLNAAYKRYVKIGGGKFEAFRKSASWLR
ncbi:MAG: 4-alpha-glucanotransferase, partial [Synergistaceae bacterium]|nr:4-alpha-glucanotransferase [Synergistaceae bacterium]